MTGIGTPVARTTLELTGPTLLERALRRAARRRGLLLVGDAGDGVPALRMAGAPHGVDLPADDDVAWAIAARATAGVLARCTPRPGRVDVVVVGPAAGVCGPARTGPVDAVRIQGERLERIGGTDAVLRLVQVQHTRCWVVTCALTPGPDAPPLGLAPDRTDAFTGADPVATTPTDTARLTQFLQDGGHGDDWPQTLLLRPVHRTPGGGLHVTAVCTDAVLADDLLDRAVATDPNGARR